MSLSEAPARRSVDFDVFAERSWPELVAEGSVGALRLTVGDVRRPRSRRCPTRAPPRKVRLSPDEEPYVDLYVALASPPAIRHQPAGAHLVRPICIGARHRRSDPPRRERRANGLPGPESRHAGALRAAARYTGRTRTPPGAELCEDLAVPPTRRTARNWANAASSSTRRATGWTPANRCGSNSRSPANRRAAPPRTRPIRSPCFPLEYRVPEAVLLPEPEPVEDPAPSAEAAAPSAEATAPSAGAAAPSAGAAAPLGAGLAADLGREPRPHRHSRGDAGGPARHPVFSGRAGAPPRVAALGAHRLPRLGARVARLVRRRAADGHRPAEHRAVAA